jgi:hypothetical protein
MLSKPINNISSNKDIFDKAAPFYNNALVANGYKEIISF